jgi:hypothetical protein
MNNEELKAGTTAQQSDAADVPTSSQTIAKPLVSRSRFEAAYGQYWGMVKDVVDENGWVYTKELPNMLDAYFEGNTGKPIEFQKSFGASGENPHWLTKGSRWRPKELSDCG